MALQGDLHSFALPDVLRLLAGTTKSGRLDVAGDAGNGEIWFDGGDLVGGEVTTSPHASRSADVVFEMLRFENGTFRFDEGSVPPDTAEVSDVDDVIHAAESLVAQWSAVERVVPSVHSSVALTVQIDTESVVISADEWRLLASIADGTTSRELGDRFEMTDLEASSRVKELVEAGLVEIGEIIEPAPATLSDLHGDPDFEFDGPDDLYQLSAEDGPVVLESRDDALLPEPLPGEGTSFVGELDELSTVDGRLYDAPAESPEPADHVDDVFEPVSLHTSDVATTGAAGFATGGYGSSDLDAEIFEPTGGGDHLDAPAPPAPGPDAPFVGEVFASNALGAPEVAPIDPDLPDEDAIDAAWSSYGSLDAMAGDEPITGGYAADDPDTAAAGPAADEDDRGSLLRFLSSVKP